MDRLREYLNTCIEERAFTCAAYSVGTAEGELYSGTLGTLGIGRGAALENTLFDLASVTKPIVATAAMRLFDRGALCLSDTVDRFLPSFAGGARGRTTLFELLTHTSDIPTQGALYKTCADKEAILTAVRFLPPRSRPPLSVEYCSHGFILVGEIVAAAAGMPLDRAMRALVFDPLQMQDTQFNPPPTLHGRIASTEDDPWRGRVVIGEVHDENAVRMGGVCGHAGLFACTSDLAALCRAMLGKKLADGTDFLHPFTRALMTKNHTQGLNLARGLGWQGKDARSSPGGDLFSESSYGHTGFTGTSLWIDPALGLYAVLLTNRVHPTRSGDAILRIRRIFHNLAVLTCCK